MAGYNVPQVKVKITPFAQPNYTSELARLMAGVGGTAGLGGTGRTTKAERKELADQQLKAMAMQVVANDPAIQEKLNKLQSAPVADQKATLQDIRRNDIRRIAEQTGVDTSTLFDAMLGPIQTQVNERYKAVSKDAGSLSSLAGGVRMGLNEMIGAFRAIGKSDEEARAIGREVYQENAAIREQSPYWQDQMLRDQTGELITGSGETGSYLANLTRMAPQMAGMIGGTLGGAAVGTAVAPGAGTIAGGVAAAGTMGAVMGSQDFINRVENDPRLTEEQKAEAIRTGRIPAAIASGVFNAIPINVNPASQALLRTAANTAVGRAVNSMGQSVAGRVVGNTLLSGAELTAANVGDVLSRNAIYEQSTGIDTPLTEGLGHALVQGAAMAPFFGAARTRTHGIPSVERPSPVQPDTTATPQTASRTQADAPVIEGYRETRTPEMMNFDESTRAGFRTGVENKSIDNVQTIYDSYVRDGRTVDDFRKFLDADVASPTPLGTDIVTRLRQLLPQEATTRSLSTDETNFITDMKQRVLNGEDLTFEQAARDYTGPRGDEKLFLDSLTSTLLDGYKVRNDLTSALYGTISKLGRKGADAEAAIGKFQQAVDKYFTDGGNDTVLARFLEDSAKNKADRTVLSPAPGKLTKAQQSLLREAIQRRQQEQANVTSTAADSNVGRNDGSGAATADSRGTSGGSRGATGTGAAAGDIAAGTVRTDSGSNGAAESGGVGRTAQQNQRAGQAVDVPVEAAGAGAASRADTGRSAEPAATGDAAAGEGAGSSAVEGLGDAGVARDAADTGGNVLTDGGDIGVAAQRLGIDVETAGRILEETGELPKTSQPEAQPTPFEATIPTEPRVVKLPDSQTAARLDNTLVENMHTKPADVMAHLQKYFEGGGSEYQLRALMKQKGKLSTRDKLLLTRAIETTPEVTPTRTNTADIRAALTGLPTEIMSKLAGRFRVAKPQTPATIEAVHQRALNLLVKESLGDKLTPTQRGQLATLHEAGVPELVLPDNLVQDVNNAKMMGMEVSPEGLVEAKTNTAETIQKITKQILCRAI